MFSDKTKAILKKQWQVSKLPVILALAWSIISYYFTNDKTIMSFVKNFIAALFFVMWFVGQYLRTAKEINDSSNYSDIQTGIADLKKAINKLQSFAPQTSIKTTNNKLLEDAKNAVNSGFILAGLMQAGVAFEQAIISKADRLQMSRDNKTTVANILRRLNEFYDSSTIQEFFAVWKLRNQLIHLSLEATSELERNPKLINYFEWAINKLENE